MKISKIDQEILDINWFAVDATGCIAHFSSDGGQLPSSVSESSEDNTMLTSYFEHAPILSSEYHINKNLELSEYVKTSEQQARCFKSFADFSMRGLFSFSRNLSNDHKIIIHTNYDRITSPALRIHLTDLPNHLQILISKTKYIGFFDKLDQIDITKTL